MFVSVGVESPCCPPWVAGPDKGGARGCDVTRCYLAQVLSFVSFLLKYRWAVEMLVATHQLLTSGNGK